MSVNNISGNCKNHHGNRRLLTGKNGTALAEFFKYRILFCICICALFFIAVFLSCPIQFESNDDMGIMYTFAGYYAGTPQYFIPFCSMFFGKIVSGLYSILPIFPWYAIFSVSVMFLSCVIVTYAIMETAKKYATPFIIGTILSIMFLCVFALRSIMLIQFTTISGFAGAAALALAAVFEPSNKRKNVLNCSLIVFMCLLSYIIRRDSFYPAALLLFVLLVYKMLMRKKIIIHYVLILVITTCLIASFETIQKAEENTPEFHQAYEFQSERSTVYDYSSIWLVKPEEVGLQPNEMTSIRGWCFLTEHVGTELFSNINRIAETRHQQSLQVRLTQTYERYVSTISGSYDSIFYLLFLLMFIATFFLRYGIPKNAKFNRIQGLHSLNGLFIFLVFVLVHGMIAYLCLVGRIPTRVFYLLIMITVPLIILDFCSLLGKRCKGKNVYILIVSIFLVSGVLLSISKVETKNLSQMNDDRNNMSSTMEQYAMAHPKNVYIYDLSLSNACSSPFKVFGLEKPVNLFFWGGWNTFTPPWYTQLKLNGMDYLDYRSFLDNNVYLLTRGPDNSTLSFFSYVEDQFAESGRSFQVVDEINEPTHIYVYQFIPEQGSDNS